MKFLHAADLHIDSPLRGLERYEGCPTEEIRGATRRALENLVDLAVEESADLVLLAGDLYDGDWKDYNTGLFFVAQMARLQAAGIRVLAISGNHDAASQITKVLQLPQNVTLLSTTAPQSVALEELGIAVHGQGFATRSVTDDLVQRYPVALPGLFNIGLLHTSLDGRPGHETYAPCTLDALRSRGYGYWALGHVHKHELVARDPWVVFPGNTQGRHARETGPKGCCLVEVTDAQTVRVEHRSLDVVRWTVCDVDLADVAGLDEVWDRVGRRLTRALDEADGRLLAARLLLRGSCSADSVLRANRERATNECRAVAATLGADNIWVEKVSIETAGLQSRDKTLARDDAFGGLLRSIHALEIDEARLPELAREVADLQVKLPADLRMSEDPLDLADPQFLRGCLDDVREMLLERLLADGRTP